MRSRRLFYVLSITFAFTLGILVAPGLRGAPAWLGFGGAARAESTHPDFATFWRAWDLVQTNYVYRADIDPKKLMYGAVRGMIESLGDDGHSRFLSPAEVTAERQGLRGRFDGIGAEVNIRAGRLVVIAPLEGSPAEKAGIRPLDTILAVDGDELTSGNLSDLTARIRGARGTTVKLTVLHQGDSLPVDLVVTRDEVRVRSTSWALVPGSNVAHMRISSFSANTSQEVRDAITAARATGATALVLDLRNNPGGLLHEAVGTASQFLADGVVTIEQDADGVRVEHRVISGGIATTLPLVVIVNRGSASSSEIVAGAMQDYGRAIVVGDRTFGTGTVLSSFDLGDGSEMYLGVKQWLTPYGRGIRKLGIQPDVGVTMAPDIRPLSPRDEQTLSVDEVRARGDVQLARAVELAAPRG